MALKKAILEAGVEMASGAKYKAQRPGWFRVLFTVEKDALEEALKRSGSIHISRFQRLTSYYRIITTAKNHRE